MSTYREIVTNATARMKEQGIPDAALDAWYLLEHITGWNRATYFLRQEETAAREQEQCYHELVQQRLRRVPLQYLTGVQEFMGFSFFVSPATLIPRQDTECLVEEAVRCANEKRVLDLCTGTGCILLSLAKLCRLSCAVGTDISQEALITARRNADNLGVCADFYCGDLFQALPKPMTFDLIVSNPPYICTQEIRTLMPEVREHEPMAALDGDRDGLRFYRSIVSEAPEYLDGEGKLIFEIGCEQAEQVCAMMEQRGFADIKVCKDYSSRNRVVSGTWCSRE